jgi:hypothetical protein
MKRASAVLLILLAAPAYAQVDVPSDAVPDVGADAPGTAPAAPAAAEAPPAQPTDEAAAIAALEPAVDTSRGAGPVAIDRLDLGTTSITGNQELPKVLYIVPWKRSDLGDLVGRPVNTLLDEVLAPVDPDVFERHLSYYETLHGETQEE